MRAVKIVRADRATNTLLATVYVEDGQLHVLDGEAGSKEAAVFREVLPHGVIFREKGRVMPSDPEFLEALQFELKSVYGAATAPMDLDI